MNTPFSRNHPLTHGRAAPFAGAAIAAAAVLALQPARAAEDDAVADLVRPEATVRLGTALLTETAPRLGMYAGTADRRDALLLDFSLASRDDGTGTWLRASGRRLGLNNRELRAEYEAQGRFGLSLDYSRTPRLEPLVVQTQLAGIGSATQTIGGTPRRDVELSTLRERTTFGFDALLPGGLKAQVQYRYEDKTGSRLFGRGTAQFLAEPIASNTQQIEASLGYVGPQLQINGGYIGSAFVNQHSVLDVNTGADIALAPDNQFHQLYVSGGYTLAPGTRATFKLAYSQGTQNENFHTAPDLPGNVQTSLHARVDTTMAQLGLTTRPLQDLSVLANLRWEQRDDKTPRVAFLTPSTGRDGFNTPFSREQSNARLEAAYRLPIGLRLTGGVDVDQRKRSTLAIRQASWRERNDETSYRLDARFGLTESLSGLLGVVHSNRGGSDYLPANNAAAADFIDPIHFADRVRDKVRLAVDWSPLDELSLQLQFDESKDRYDGRPRGPQSGHARLLALDANYTVSEAWQVFAWLTRDINRSTQLTTTGANAVAGITAQDWQARLGTVGNAAGLGVRGRPSEVLDIGLDATVARDSSAYILVGNLPASAGLPSISTYRTAVNAYASYQMQRNLRVRVDLGHERMRTDDWTWTGWVYADGTTVNSRALEHVGYIGVSLLYRWW